MKFSDPIDQGKHLADLHNANSVAEHRRRAAPQQVQNKDGTWPVTQCDACNEPIERPRIEAGRIRCYDCQLAKEEEDATHAKR